MLTPPCCEFSNALTAAALGSPRSTNQPAKGFGSNFLVLLRYYQGIIMVLLWYYQGTIKVLLRSKRGDWVVIRQRLRCKPLSFGSYRSFSVMRRHGNCCLDKLVVGGNAA